MSGICAIWQRSGERPDRRLEGMTKGLALVAGEAVRQSVDGGTGIALSARFAPQQMFEDQTILIACDAELYNQEELEGTLSERADFSGENGVAMLLAELYRRWGVEFIEKLRGAFAIVLWDRRSRKLVAAIDGFGIGRLVYAEHAGVLTVASRVDALAASGIPLDINPRAIANCLNFTSNLAPETIFTQIHRLIPGAMLIAEDGGTRIAKYWDMRYGVGEEAGEDRLGRELESVIERSVAVHCKNDPLSSLGAFLSGGTDSSTVAGMMSRMKRGPVNTFSIGFQEQPFNELGYAQIAATRFQTKHHTYLVGADDCASAIPAIIRCFDEPYGNSSAIPTYFCAKLAADNSVKALLAGDGGDELFGGNERYLTDKIFATYAHVPRVVRKALIEPSLGLFSSWNGLFGKARRYVARANQPPVKRFLSGQFLCANDPGKIFQPDFLTALRGYSVLDIPSAHYQDAPARDHLDRLLYLDLKITLADNDLPKVTCASELAGIRTRFPFLDRSVAEFSGRVPASLKVKGTEKRYLFKKGLRNLLPIEIIKKKKHGFGIPVAQWMKSDPRMRELTRDTLLSGRLFGRGYFQRKPIEELFRMHETTDDTPYYGDILWTFLTLELWHRRVVDAPVGIAP